MLTPMIRPAHAVAAQDPLGELDAELKQRRAAQRSLGRSIDALLQGQTAAEEDAAPHTGCFAVLSRLLGRRRPGTRPLPVSDAAAVVGASPASAATAASATAAAAARRTGHSVFGLAAGKRVDATARLEEAAATMRVRVEQLEERVVEQRGEAKRLGKAGQKQAALRALKKANAVQRQVDSNQAAVDAVEQQMDALSQAAMQKTLASALASTSKTMKKDAKALGRAEAAIDDAQEARDMATDLNQVMVDFAANGGGCEDEDELTAELDAMLAEWDDPTPPPAAAVNAAASSADSQREAAAQLQRKHGEWDAAEAVRARMPATPAHGNGRARTLEKTSLLAGQPRAA